MIDINNNILFIPGNVPSSKNSKVVTANGIFNSKTVTKYLRSLGIKSFSSSKKEVKIYVRTGNLFVQHVSSYFNNHNFEKEPMILGIHFVRNSRHKFDFHNICQILLDLLIAHKIIPDDNMDCIIPIPMKKNGKYYTYDKLNPGVYLKILNK